MPQGKLTYVLVGMASLAAGTPFEFRAPLGWVGHMERRAPATLGG